MKFIYDKIYDEEVKENVYYGFLGILIVIVFLALRLKKATMVQQQRTMAVLLAMVRLQFSTFCTTISTKQPKKNQKEK